MTSTILPGILLIALGAFLSGSFSVPFGKIKDWIWETSWMIFSVGAYILFPLIAYLIFAPNFITIIHTTNSTVLWAVFLMGAVYGIGNLSFGLQSKLLSVLQSRKVVRL